MSKSYTINGVIIDSWYEGLGVFCVNGNVCYSLDTLSKWVGVDVETLKDEMWKQR